MTNVLLRDVPEDVLAELKTAAVSNGQSLQAYLLETVNAQVSYVRGQAALSRATQRLAGMPGLSEEDHRVIREAIEHAHAERADQLGDNSR